MSKATELRLVRLSERLGATLGALLIDGAPEFVTLELPWRNNERNISCIPVGQYQLGFRQNARTTGGTLIPATYEVLFVPGRSGILFHVGNSAEDSNGCILLGQRWGNVRDKAWIYESRIAFERFQRIVEINTTPGRLTVVRSW